MSPNNQKKKKEAQKATRLGQSTTNKQNILQKLIKKIKTPNHLNLQLDKLIP